MWCNLFWCESKDVTYHTDLFIIEKASLIFKYFLHQIILCWEHLASNHLSKESVSSSLMGTDLPFSRVSLCRFKWKIKCLLAFHCNQVFSSSFLEQEINFVSLWGETLAQTALENIHFTYDKSIGQNNAGYLKLFWIRIKCHLRRHTTYGSTIRRIWFH